jgi:uncharacterized membrane protein
MTRENGLQSTLRSDFRWSQTRPIRWGSIHFVWSAQRSEHHGSALNGKKPDGWGRACAAHSIALAMTSSANPEVVGPSSPCLSKGKIIARCVLAALLVGAGVGHLTWARISFLAQVPDWVPFDTDVIVLVSGVIEIGLGTALIGVRSRWCGWVVGAFFVVVFPGNISPQYVAHRDAFGLDTDARRLARLFFQPVLIAWAVWSTSPPNPKRSPK